MTLALVVQPTPSAGMAALEPGDDPGVVHQNIALFVDGTNFGLCRVRGRNNLQESLYDGHHREHALVLQGVVAPNGLLVDVSGLYPGRRHDDHIVGDSRLNERMRESQDGNVFQYKIMGDKAYSVRSHIGSPFVGNDLTPPQRAFNLNLSKLRVSVEHAFGKTKVMSAFVTYDTNMRLFGSPVGRYFVNAVIIANCHTCMNGSLVGQYFGVAAPSIHEYLGVSP